MYSVTVRIQQLASFTDREDHELGETNDGGLGPFWGSLEQAFTTKPYTDFYLVLRGTVYHRSNVYTVELQGVTGSRCENFRTHMTTKFMMMMMINAFTLRKCF